jgi:DNA replication protein DnaC
MSTDSMQPSECPLCRGTGWKVFAVDRNVPTVTRCDCRVLARASRLLAQAEIPRQYEHCTLADFDVTFRSATESLKRALLAVKRFVEQYPLEKEGMLLWGDCGTGKTHLAIAILKELVLQKGARCLFRGYSALLKQLQATYSRQTVAYEDTGVVLTEYSILRDVTDVEVLVLDDLGAEKSSEWTLSMLYHVINERYNQGRTTIITTNLPWEEAQSAAPVERMTAAQRAMKPETLRERISERTYSRITEMCPIRLQLVSNKDYRQIRGARSS